MKCRGSGYGAVGAGLVFKASGGYGGDSGVKSIEQVEKNAKAAELVV